MGGLTGPAGQCFRRGCCVCGCGCELSVTAAPVNSSAGLDVGLMLMESGHSWAHAGGWKVQGYGTANHPCTAVCLSLP